MTDPDPGGPNHMNPTAPDPQQWMAHFSILDKFVNTIILRGIVANPRDILYLSIISTGLTTD
jgi:hypothetical protein